MKTLTTKRTTRRIAASIAIATALATSGAWAADVYWTGKTDNYWNNSGNWKGAASGRPLPTSDVMFFDGSQFDERFSDNEVIFDGAYTNTWQCNFNNVGTAENPFVLRATDAAYGLQFSRDKNTYLGDTTAAYVRLESGTWSVSGSNSKILQIDNGQLTLTNGASLSVGRDTVMNNANSKVTVMGGASFYTTRYFAHKAGEVNVENGTIEVAGNNYQSRPERCRKRADQ